MRLSQTGFVLIVAGVLASSGRVSAQAPVGGPIPSVEVDPILGPDRRGTMAEGLEILTGATAERDEIETDRDSFTPATVIVSRRRLIVEAAGSFIDNRRGKETYSFPELILRYGLTDRIELRLGWNAEIGGAKNEVAGSEGGGDLLETTNRVEKEYTVAYGVKVRVTDQETWLPRSVLIVQGFTPTGGSPGTTAATQLVATYAAGWVFSNRWQLDASIRYGFDSEKEDRFNLWAPSAVLRVPLGEKLGVHAEYFGEFTSGKERNSVLHFLSPGARYLVTSDLELGVRVGWGLNAESARFFANAGIGWRY